MRVPLLTEDELAPHLLRLPVWERQGGVIQKTYTFRDFSQAMKFVNMVAETAEDVDHHPDIDIRYHKVTLALTTYDAGGLTLSDIELAASCDDLADGIGQ